MVNNLPFQWRNGLTINIFLEELRSDIRFDKLNNFHDVVVVINKMVIRKSEYSELLLSEGDDVEIIPLLSGG